MFKRGLGVIAVSMGAAILLWVGYNLFIERQPVAEGRSPIPALIFSVAAIGVGIRWILRKSVE